MIRSKGVWGVLTITALVGIFAGAALGPRIFGVPPFPYPVWGTVGEWVGGIGAASAAAVAVWQMNVSARAQRRAEDQRRLAAAMAVTVSRPMALGTTADGVRIEVRNGSQSPVYGVRVFVSDSGTVVSEFAVGTLAPGQVLDLDASMGGRRWRKVELQPSVTFRDAENIAWVSSDTGVERLPGAGPRKGRRVGL